MSRCKVGDEIRGWCGFVVQKSWKKGLFIRYSIWLLNKEFLDSNL